MQGFQILRIDDDHFECIHCGGHFHKDKMYVRYTCKECHLFNRKCNYLGNKERDIKRALKYQKERPEMAKKSTYAWNNRNKKRFREIQTTYQIRRSKIDPCFKIARVLRSRIRKVLKQKTKLGSHIKDLGCSVQFLKQYLESKFQQGMTWKNHGTHGWHIDHIKPLANFDLTDREQFLEACHYTNLQPLWAKDNIKKSNS